MYLKYKGIIDFVRNYYFKKIIKKFNININSKLLDYGCGPGDMLQVCKINNIDAIGVDAYDYSINLARERGFEVYKGNYDNLEFEEFSFDVIFLQSVIEHIKNPVEALNTLKKYLKEDGLLIISAPTPGNGFWDDPTHIRPFTPRSFYNLSDLIEMEIVEVNYIFSFLLGLKLNNKFFYKILNLFPYSLGSNIIGVYKGIK